ncbi:MAG: hypothetical protein MJE77_41870 [Proteobacteria bacterium]|nr:hypothetical protein [Pseudomonadota bacterium]
MNTHREELVIPLTEREYAELERRAGIHGQTVDEYVQHVVCHKLLAYSPERLQRVLPSSQESQSRKAIKSPGRAQETIP